MLKIVLVFLLALSINPCAFAKRIAFAVGNDNYQHITKLNKAGNDADTMADEFKKAGFDVEIKKNINYKNMVRSIESFLSKVNKGDEVVFFYAGHGVQLRTGPYLLPVDIEAESEAEIEKFSVGLYDLSEKINERKAIFSLIILDACRDNPFAARTRAIGTTRGLSAIEPAKGQMVVYSAGRGQQALDSLNDKDMNPNSVFTREFVNKIRQPGIRIDELVRQVQDSVELIATKIGHEQRPSLYNESRGNFYFYAPLEETESKIKISEDAFWNDTKLAGNKQAFEAYLKEFPTGKYANLAKANITKLNGKLEADFNTDRKLILEEINAWNEAKKTSQKSQFESYLAKYPNGFFAGLATENIKLLDDVKKLADLEKANDQANAEKIVIASRLINETRKQLMKEERVNLDLVKSLLKIDVPTF